MLSVTGNHNSEQVFCDVVLMPVENLDGMDVYTDLPQPPKVFVLRALIDTGATQTCIIESAAKKLDLVPLGYVPTMGIHGVSEVRYYLFRIGFIKHESSIEVSASNEMSVLQKPIQGTELQIENAGFEVLLGMDALSCGNLHIWANGQFRFEFDNTNIPCL